jgi:hypothetical protein
MGGFKSSESLECLALNVTALRSIELSKIGRNDLLSPVSLFKKSSENLKPVQVFVSLLPAKATRANTCTASCISVT